MISIDNLLAICAHFRALPEHVVLIEIEPAEDTWGEAPSAAGARALDTALALARREVARVQAA